MCPSSSLVPKPFRPPIRVSEAIAQRRPGWRAPSVLVYGNIQHAFIRIIRSVEYGGQRLAY
jgi:hypothetical protein